MAILLVACSSTTATPSPTGILPTASSIATLTPTASLSPTATLIPTASPSPTASLTPTLMPSSTPSVAPTIALCTSSQLVARITLWEGAAGHRIADVELTNSGVACRLSAQARPQLVEGHGAILIDGAAPATTAPILTLAAGGVLKTLVQDGNYCGPTPAAPVTVAFVWASTTGRVVALPVSATDTDGVPPCNGPSGSAGDIEMHAWAP